MMPFGISFIIVYSQRLEETTAALQVTSEALEQEKAKTDMLLHQMLPVKVAEALKDGHRVEAGKSLLHQNITSQGYSGPWKTDTL